jgi:hypothetical protein
MPHGIVCEPVDKFAMDVLPNTCRATLSYLLLKLKS